MQIAVVIAQAQPGRIAQFMRFTIARLFFIMRVRIELKLELRQKLFDHLCFTAYVTLFVDVIQDDHFVLLRTRNGRAG